MPIVQRENRNRFTNQLYAIDENNNKSFTTHLLISVKDAPTLNNCFLFPFSNFNLDILICQKSFWLNSNQMRLRTSQSCSVHTLDIEWKNKSPIN